MFTSIFTMETGPLRPVLDAFLCYDQDDVVVKTAAARVLGEGNPDLTLLMRSIEHITMRGRFAAGGGPYIVRTDERLDRDTLEAVIKDKHKHDSLLPWLERATL